MRDRAGEEEVVSRLVINALGRSSGIEDELPLGLTPRERPEVETHLHDNPIRQLLSGEANTVSVSPDGVMTVDEPLRATVLSGSFSPLHHGHERLAATAAETLGAEVVFELSVVNVDKPPLEEAEIRRRLSQFAGKARVVLTRAETFRKKASLLPGNTFVIGWDTAVRLIDPKYYGGEPEAMLTALAEIWALGCRFLVAGRESAGEFHTLSQIPMPEGFSYLFQEIPESLFREDISSTYLRTQG